MNKQELRQAIRARKRAMTEEDILRRSEILAEKFARSDAYRAAKTIYGYLPYNQEVRTVPMLRRALEEGKRVAVPKVYGDDMKFIYLDDLSQVAKGYAGIPEPVADGPVAQDETALVLMPGLAFDPQGHRIGYGGGFYDRYLADREALRLRSIAVGFRCQQVESVPVEETDVKPYQVILV